MTEYAKVRRSDGAAGEDDDGDTSVGGRCLRISSFMLLHLNLLLVLFSGAALAMGVRLRWDPTAYVPLREALPNVYSAAATVLPMFSLIVLFLAHLAVCARAYSSHRRHNLLLIYGVSMVVMMVCEVIWLTWTATSISSWLKTEEAKAMQEALGMTDHIRPIMETLSRWHPIPTKINDIMKEVEEDAPVNVYVAGVCLVATLLLQGSAAAAALTLATKTRRPSIIDDNQLRQTSPHFRDNNMEEMMRRREQV